MKSFIFSIALTILPIIPFAQIFGEDYTKIIEKAISGTLIVTSLSNKEPEARPLGLIKSDASVNAYSWQTSEVGASGFVVSYNNTLLIITNEHVTRNLTDVDGFLKVYSHTGKTYKVKLIAGDSFYDVAILEFVDKPGNEINPLLIRDPSDKIKIGETVFAIGHPLINTGDLQYTVTNGIVSGLNRIQNEAVTSRYGLIQHTAPTLWGNSGGPLIDSYGRVIGINSQIKLISSFVSIPTFYINFSLENRIILKTLKDVLKHGRVIRPYFGLIFNELAPLYSNKRMVTVEKVLDDSPLKNIIQPGDIICKINDIEIETFDNLLLIFDDILPNSKVRFTVKRLDETHSFDVYPSKLSLNALSTIAKSFFEKNFSDYSLLETSDGLFILDKKNQRKEKIIKAGSNENSLLWSIKTLSDLGIAIRITTLSENFDLITQEDIYSKSFKKLLYY